MTTPAPPISAADMKWPELLKDQYAIAEYISEHAPYEIEEEMIEELYHGSRAKLTWIELGSLILSKDDNHLACEERQGEVDRLPVSTMPPLFVDDSRLEDGYHRLRKLLKEGATHHWAYIVEAIPEPELEVTKRKPSRWDALYGMEP